MTVDEIRNIVGAPRSAKAVDGRGLGQGSARGVHPDGSVGSVDEVNEGQS